MATIAAVIASTHHPFYLRASTATGDDRPPFADEWVAKIEAFRETLTRARPDVLVMVGSDHFHQLWLDNMPQFLIGKAPFYDANYYNEEREFGLPRMGLRGDEELSAYLLRGGMDAGHGASRSVIKLGAAPGACIFWPTPNVSTPGGIGRHALVPAPHSNPARGSRRRRRGEPPAAAARRVHPAAHGRSLQHAAARHPGPDQGHQRDPGGDEPDRRPGVPAAVHAAGLDLGEERAAGDHGRGDVPAHRPQGR